MQSIITANNNYENELYEISIFYYSGYYNQNKEISVNINVPVLILSKCELGDTKILLVHPK